jgi:hypothetical protein
LYAQVKTAEDQRGMQTWDTRLKEELQILFKARQVKNKNYSLRAFAKSLDVSPATLSRPFSGRWAPSRKSVVAKLVTNAKLDPSITAEYDAAHGMAILTISPEDPDFRGDTAWIAARLGLTKKAAKDAVEGLVRLGLMHRSGDKLVPVNRQLSASGRFKSKIDTKKSRILMLEKAKQTVRDLTPENFDDSDISYMCTAIDRSRLPEAKQRIIKFRRSLACFLNTGKNLSEVYILSLQLFPVSRLVKK